MSTSLDMDKFKEALELLDWHLEELGKIKPLDHKLTIKAIGGFALLYHGVRSSGYTVDIDSVTPDYSQDVVNCIYFVSEKLGIFPDWINNYNVLDGDVDSIENLLEAFWIESEMKLRHIDLWVADLETLLRAKLIAAEDDDLSGRVQDFPDVLDIFRKLECNNIGRVIQYCEDADIDLISNFPRCYSRLMRVFSNDRKIMRSFG